MTERQRQALRLAVRSERVMDWQAGKERVMDKGGGRHRVTDSNPEKRTHATH